MRNHADQQNEQVDCNLQRTACQGIFHFDNDELSWIFGTFRYPAPDKIDPVFFLGFEVHLLKMAVKHPEIHIKVENLRFREDLPEFDGLFHTGYTANL